jgi:hypothetical protein
MLWAILLENSDEYALVTLFTALPVDTACDTDSCALRSKVKAVSQSDCDSYSIVISPYVILVLSVLWV